MTCTTVKQTNKIIEIIGPPGVGKSTLYNALCKHWQPDLRWTYPDILLSVGKPSVVDFKKWIEYKLRIALGKKRARSISVDYGLRFISENEEFASLCWNHLSNSDASICSDLDKRYRSAYFLFADFCRYQALKETSNKKLCLLEEGFLQKSFLISKNGSPLPHFIEAYLSFIPLPHAVICLDVENSTIISSRLRQRHKVIASHIGKDDKGLIEETEKWQQTLNFILHELEKKGVLIYRVDGTNTLEENTRHIARILDEI